ncbi:ornithine carbamoyltransferase [Aestuariivirga litoralis]|uniref:ornithine carbamoyltransferase n=1 Tax=Aestuariivirga litoralis TaxID=2650924 RepID=UPI0018C4BF56|nr:ornithine carbamoyltransferase [Aestuariivirga litoralis]MBG1232846.1 ornithine carbamoyltransferase [Aestuariivirga litoralis]
MSHFLDLKDFSKPQLRSILTEANSRKKARAKLFKGEPDADKPLKGKAIALIFERPSTRTRFSFEMGIRQLGGEVFTVSGAEMQLGRGETIADTARVVSRYVDAVMIRAKAHHTLLEFADAATIPVVNGLTNATHPCQVMADVLTLEERKGSIEKTRSAWVGDGNNVCASWIEAVGILGGALRIASPKELMPNPEFLNWAKQKQADIEVTHSAQEAVKGADNVITDCWLSMHDADEEKARRNQLLRPYQVNEALMKHAAKDALFMHCLPAHRNEEVTDAVFDGPASVVFDEAENRVHAQKAILLSCFAK